MDIDKTRSLYTMIFEIEEKLFAMSGIRLPFDHKTGKEYIEAIKKEYQEKLKI